MLVCALLTCEAMIGEAQTVRVSDFAASFMVGSMEEAVRAAGLTPVRLHHLERGSRELWVWKFGFGQTARLVWLARRPRGVEGNLLLLALGDHPSRKWVRESLDVQCTRIGVLGHGTACSLPSPRNVEWTRVLGLLASIGASTLAGRDRHGLDGWSLVVGVRDETGYRRGYYWMPDPSQSEDPGEGHGCGSGA